MYEKRLLVLGGNGTGCVRLERTSGGIKADLSVSNIGGDNLLIVAMSGNERAYFLPSTLARAYGFSLPYSWELSKLTIIIAQSNKLAMYGTLMPVKLWQSQLESEINRARKIHALPEKEKKVSDFFFNIIPSDDYDDGKLAEVNYYKSNLESHNGKLAEATPPPPISEMPNNDIRPEIVENKTSHLLAPQYDSTWQEHSQRIGSDESDRVSATTETTAHCEYITSNIEGGVFDTYEIDGEQKCESLNDKIEKKYSKGTFGSYINRQKTQSLMSTSEEKNEYAKSTSEAQPLSQKEKIAPPKEDESVMPPREKKPPVLETAIFYDTVKAQVERLFARNEHHGTLERLLPESKWVRIDYDNKGKHYLVGLIGEPVRYLCYGVPSKYSPRPPVQLAGYCQWLAIDQTNPSGEGFWIMYQDAVTGRSVL